MNELGITPIEKNKILKQAQSGNIKLVEDFKNKLPNFHWSILRYDKTGDTILHCASRLGHSDTVRYLLTFKPSSVDCKNNDDKTALHEAAQFSQPEIVEILIENGAEINALKRADWTPLMLACTKSNYETVQLLVENKALLNYKNKDGWTSLHLAAREGCVRIFQLLVDKGGEVTMETKNGRNVLHIAALHGNIEIVEMLLKLGLDVNMKDKCGNTPLHEAVLGRNLEICRKLIENGANIRCVNNVEFNLLHLASSEGYNEIVDFIVAELGFDVNEVNANGFTALHCAARKGQEETFWYLKKLGCDQNIKDRFNRSALDYLGSKKNCNNT